MHVEVRSDLVNRIFWLQFNVGKSRLQRSQKRSPFGAIGWNAARNILRSCRIGSGVLAISTRHQRLAPVLADLNDRGRFLSVTNVARIELTNCSCRARTNGA
jgi:hypothetical protein